MPTLCVNTAGVWVNSISEIVMGRTALPDPKVGHTTR